MIIKKDDMKRLSIQTEHLDFPGDLAESDPSKQEANSQESRILYYEDLVIGQQWSSPARSITAEDVQAFSQLTGDYDPLHKTGVGPRKNASAEQSPFGRPIAHGLLGLSVLAGLSTEYPCVATLALVGVTDWQFEKPIFFGDKVHVLTEVSEITPHGRRAGRITWLRKLVCEDGRVLQQGKFITLVASYARKRAVSDGGTKLPQRPR